MKVYIKKEERIEVCIKKGWKYIYEERIKVYKERMEVYIKKGWKYKYKNRMRVFIKKGWKYYK